MRAQLVLVGRGQGRGQRQAGRLQHGRGRVAGAALRVGLRGGPARDDRTRRHHDVSGLYRSCDYFVRVQC